MASPARGMTVPAQKMNIHLIKSARWPAISERRSAPWVAISEPTSASLADIPEFGFRRHTLMPQYTFEQLSPYDFETLVRDLLQAEQGIRLESFTTGADRGIDLRYAQDPKRTLIVQCKHYARSTWPTLLSALRKETARVAALAPQRWILATSVPLTPQRKDVIRDLFHPYSKQPADIFGQDDINNLLGLHPAIERSQFKLWLTSVPVLQQLLHSDIFSEQASEIASIRRRIDRFVTNPSVTRATSVLEAHHFCLIAGVPGIGKTTLAEMLIAEHILRGYECYRIWEGIDEARKVYTGRGKQLFYYDDFLGRTGLREPLRRNEDQRLLRFIADVQQNPLARFLLTTRDYILNQARWLTEGLRSAVLDVAKCVVDLADYAPMTRAHILYNHLYYSRLPRPYLEAIVRSRTYRSIVRHRNYNPRLIEVMTDAINLQTIPPEEYPEAFVATLDNPGRLWEVAFDSHLSLAGQNIVLALSIMPDRARELDLREAFDALQQHRRVAYSQAIAPSDWQRALREVDGTFIRVESSHGEWHVILQNASVRDFIEARLRMRDTDLDDLLASAPFWDQADRLYEILNNSQSLNEDLRRAISRRMLACFEARSIRLVAVHYRASRDVRWMNDEQSPIRRLLRLRVVTDGLVDGHDMMASAASSVKSYLASPHPAVVEVAHLLTTLADMLPRPQWAQTLWDPAVEAAFHDIRGRVYDIPGFDALATFLDDHGDEVDSAYQTELRSAFESFVGDEVDVILQESDIDTRLNWYDELQAVALRFGTDLGLSREDVADPDDVPWQEDEDGPYLSAHSTEPGTITDHDLDGMFDSLRDTE
jgi:hypothetical protein